MIDRASHDLAKAARALWDAHCKSHDAINPVRGVNPRKYGMNYGELVELKKALDDFDVASNSDPNANREHYNRAYTQHGEGIVVTQENGDFHERPMTAAELAAREPAMKIATQIHKLAHYAAFAYIESWEIIAPVVAKAVSDERQRCVDIVQAARFGEVDRDWRSVSHMIEGGQSLEEIKL